MGMYDYIDFEYDCPNCKQKIKDFQSKDGKCILDKLKYWEVDNFYSLCENCGTWVSFYRKKKKIPISHYDIKYTLNTNFKR
jgi:hypothetical protein